MEQKIVQYILMIVIASTTIASQSYALKVDGDSALKAVKEIENNCDENCNQFLLNNFKNQIINHLNNSPNFLKKLSKDIQWAINNNCTAEAESVNDLVDIVSGKVQAKTREKPECRFKFFDSLEEPKRQNQDSGDVVFAPTIIHAPKFIHATKPLYTNEQPIGCGTGCYTEVIECSVNECQPRLPFLRRIARGFGLIRERRFFRRRAAKIGGVDVGGGRVSPTYAYVGGVDVGGGMVDPRNFTYQRSSLVTPQIDEKSIETKKLLKQKHQTSEKIAKFLTFRDYLSHKEKKEKLSYKDYSEYLKYQGINEVELKRVVEESQEKTSISEGLKKLQDYKRSVENQLKTKPLSGSQYFTKKDREELNKEFIFHLGSKVIK